MVLKKQVSSVLFIASLHLSVAIIFTVFNVLAISLITFEAESGMRTGGTTVSSDATASGGSALIFTNPQNSYDYGNDTWLFVGDSITVMSINDSLATIVKSTNPTRNPVIINEAIGGTNAGSWSDSDPSMGSISEVLASSDARFVPIALGTNDYQPAFKAEYEKLIQAVIAAGRIPVLPYMPWTNGGDNPGKEALINADIDSLLAKYNQAMKGPDLYAVTVNKPELFQGPGNVHPNSAGQEVIRQAWAQTMLSKPPSISTYPDIESNFDINAYLMPEQFSPESSASEPSGNFRFLCSFAKLGYYDPIVYPNQADKGHLHMFFGNTEIGPDSTYNSLRTTGDSTCRGGPINRTGYWMPALFDAKDNNRVVIPNYFNVYYKGGVTCGGNYQARVACIQSVKDIPNGFRYIAGYDMNAPANQVTRHFWYCSETQNKSNKIPNSCPPGEDLIVSIEFPQCWDGVNIDSPNHRSHTAYIYYDPNDGQPKCPSTHPVRIPELTEFAVWEDAGDTSGWSVSSDHMPGMTHDRGSTIHADWFGAWDNAIMEGWIQNCIRGMRNASSGMLCNGQQLKENVWYNGPMRISGYNYSR